MKRAFLPLLSLVLAMPTAAQQRADFTRPDAAFPEPFSQLRGVRELPDGRVLVSDLTDKVVQIVDLRTGAATRVGREGQGPGEYVFPAGLWPLGDGRTLLYDLGKMRLLEIDDARGTIGKEHSPPRATPPGSSGPPIMIGGMTDIRGVDAHGRVYYQGVAFDPATGQGGDSVPILRWDIAGNLLDTVAWKPVPPEARPQVTRSGSNNLAVRIGMNRAWPVEPQWGVAADGRIALVTPQPYRVTWIAPGGPRRVGPEVRYSPIRVTEADKQAWRDAMARAPRMIVSAGPGGTSRTLAPAGGSGGPPPEDPIWPEVKPPFSGASAVLVTPEGEVWVERTRSARDDTPRYEVFDGTGSRVREVTLRPRSRVIAFGKGTVYVIRMDQDDLQYLERYPR